MIRSAQAFALLAVMAASATVHAGLSVTPNAPILPGTTVLFDLTYVSGAVTEIDTIGPDVEFSISSTGTGTDPSFTTSGVPTLVAPWEISLVDASFFSTNLNGSDPVPATFGQLSVDIPGTFSGDIDLSPVGDFDVFSAGPVVETILQTEVFSFTTVPEPNAFVFLAMVGSVFAGVKYARKRFA